MKDTPADPERAATTAPEIRDFERTDAQDVANLFVATMRSGRGHAGPDLARYVVGHFLDGPFAHPDTPSRVAIAPDGTLSGFVGATRHSLHLGEVEKTVAIGSTLMVRDHASDPMTGARLLRALLSGPQDATVSETASEPSLPMWEKLGGEVLPAHSLDFVRVLRPAAYALTRAGRRVGPVGVLAPLTRPLDNWAARRHPTPTWTSLPRAFQARGGAQCRPLSPESFRDHALTWLARYDARPAYDDAALELVIATAQQKSGLGTARLREVTLPSGKVLGAVLYHLAPAGDARLHCLLATPGQEGSVLDALLADARDAGAIALTGRIDPVLFEPLSRRRAVFARESATLMRTKNPDLAHALRTGLVPFNGLFGERWTRLIGDDALWK